MTGTRPIASTMLAIGVLLAAGCGGGGSLPSSLSNASHSSGSPSATLDVNAMVASERAASTMTALASVDPTSEELIAVHNKCTNVSPSGGCDFTSDPLEYNETISRWQLVSQQKLGDIKLSGHGGASAMVASPDDRYFLTADVYNGVEVDGTDGTQRILLPLTNDVAELFSSSDLRSDFALEADNTGTTLTVYGYREPFTSPYGHVSVPALSTNFSNPNADVAANSDGSNVFIAQSSGTSTQVSIGNLTTGALQTASFPASKGEYPEGEAVFDPRHQWFYFLSSPNNNNFSSNRVQIFATNTKQYLGYINLPTNDERQNQLAIDASTGDLYVELAHSVNVYNVASCGCTIPRRSFSLASNVGGDMALDRSGTHLVIDGLAGSNPYASWAYDYNPHTGSLWRRFVLTQGSEFDQDNAAVILAQ